MAIKSYWDAVQIREGKPAYNIEMEEQGNWETFLPNMQFNEILVKALSAVRNNDMDKHRSLWIEGTYGTGKSHAGAVIKHLLCDNVEEIRNWIEEEYREPQYDILRKQIYSLRENKRLMPVTLVGQCGISNKEDLALVLQTRIHQALQQQGLDLDIKTDYDNYVQHIEQNADFWDLTIAADGELRSVAPDRKRLIKLLRDYDSATLRTAKDACRRKGLSVRLKQENLGRWFFEVQNKLREKSGYCGLLVVWDEFTDVMNSDLGPSLLVELQILAEEAMNSENDSYFLFISHPSALDRLTAQERTKTTDRYNFLHYNMETVSAFKIMSRKFRQIVPLDQISASVSFYSEAKDLYSLLSKTSNQPEETESDLKKLFPLHPSTANLATYYAREVGSSSRSVFDFLASDPVRDFLQSAQMYKQGETITADYLWDYIYPEMQQNVSKFGVVNERYNSYAKIVEHQGDTAMRVFKGILLLNALNNIANNELVVPSEENIHNLFVGTMVITQLPEVLNWMNETGVIQRSPAGLYEIRFSALPLGEVNSIKEDLKLNQFRFTYNILRASSSVRNLIVKRLVNVSRPLVFEVFSLDSNESTLFSNIERTFKSAKGYELKIAILFGRNADELTMLRETAKKATTSEEGRFDNTVFLVMDKTMGNNEYERYIEYQANAQCAQRHGFADQMNSHSENADKMVKEWVESALKGIAYIYTGDEPISIDAGKITSFINCSIAPLLFSKGPEGLEIIRLKNSSTYWKKAFAKSTVETVLQHNTKQEIVDRCKGPAMHIAFLLQDSVDENLQFKENVDPEHPLYQVCQFVKNKIDKADKQTNFNLSYHLEALTKPPYGLYPSQAGMAMVAFALRPYIGKIFDLNGKPRTATHLVEDVVELFKVWDGGGNRNKLEFKFQTKEEGQLSKMFISIFKLNTLKDYHEVSSLIDARWALTSGYLKEKGAPLWGLKYCNDMSEMTMHDDLCLAIDNVLKVCGPEGLKDKKLMTDTLELLKKYDFELKSLLTVSETKNNFTQGLENFLMAEPMVKLKQSELAAAMIYIKQNMQGEVGLWTEEDVAEKLKNWRLSTMTIPTTTYPESPASSSNNPTIPSATDYDDTIPKAPQTKVALAKDKVKSIQNLDDAKKILEKMADLGFDNILDIIIND